MCLLVSFCVALFCRNFCVNFCGGRWFVLFVRGKFVFALVCDFDINLCEKNGGDYVMVIFTLVVLIGGIFVCCIIIFIGGKYLFA